MCLIAFAYKAHPKYKLILTANRDEFYARPTAAADWWTDYPFILGGRDLQAQGTWMAISKDGRFAAVTNYRDLHNIRDDARSRGDLPTNFLVENLSSVEYAQEVFKRGPEYNGFNLLVMDDDMAHVSNYDDQVNVLTPGIYGLSNALLDTPWPKVTKAKEDFQSVIETDFEMEDLIGVMLNTDLASDDRLPDTGLDYEREKAISAMCIVTPDYGTCCTTVITIDYQGQVEFIEKSYPVGDRMDQIASFSFNISQEPHE